MRRFFVSSLLCSLLGALVGTATVSSQVKDKTEISSENLVNAVRVFKYPRVLVSS